MKNLGLMIFNTKSPWFMGIVSGTILVMIGVVFFSLSEYRKRKIKLAHRKIILENADHLLESNMVEEALAIYSDLLTQISRIREPKVFAHVKHSEGVCYKYLASTKEPIENLKKRSFVMKKP